VVSDDVEMAITHVVRGDDHISKHARSTCCCTARIGAAVAAVSRTFL
jgi:glutamyl/glutaminyl-tRNA synthetase